MDAYRVNITPILEDLGASIEVCDEVGLDSLVVGDETFTARGPARVDVRLTNTGSGVVGEGSIAWDVTAVCARCLCEFPLTLEGEVDGYYVAPGREEGIPEDQEYEFFDADGLVDIAPALMAALVLDAPFAPVHDETCEGLCAECGADLNEGPCDCEQAGDADNPFAALGSLLEVEHPGDA
jgi:uncharacterized protein